MSYQYRFTKQVEKFLEKQSRDFLVLFQSKLEILIQNPFTSELDTKPLKGLPHNYRLRVGKYRFLYKVEKDKLYIYFYKSGRRGDVYK